MLLFYTRLFVSKHMRREPETEGRGALGGEGSALGAGRRLAAER